MSGIYNIEHYVMTWTFLNCEHMRGSRNFRQGGGGGTGKSDKKSSDIFFFFLVLSFC